MSGENFQEKRKFTRFEVNIPSRNLAFSSINEIRGQTRDISSKGIGINSREGLPVGAALDVWLIMPDNDEEIHIAGKVAWVAQAGKDAYRMGIMLDKDELKPIPLVLRTIHMRTKHYG